ncbi:Nucleoside diphosphate kinase-like domain superfamily [Arabidopsis thaliana x Arabidopsis arenosa]|uniref:nucleoside-diphosphate kinase n=1 Tax=Arabidopsis thaliana x Arabidopsis arenosa TaxID=1240361 RepID=A0A8T1ZIW3_9BRAS|nr:Nucleoside diphosphate kinase-like domain superfamily [Arabidopsis thaliana x Arabidopsis arenosa]
MPEKKKKKESIVNAEKKRRRKASKMEKTFVMIKPDGVQRRLMPEIIRRFEEKRFTLKGMKMMSVERDLAEKHYEELSGEHVFGRLVDYIVSSGPVVAMIWEGENVVETVREMIGHTRPSDCEYATIRGEFGIDKIRNVIHGSYSLEIANKEIALWFPEGPLVWDKKINNHWHKFDC